MIQMPSYEHNKLVGRFEQLDAMPGEPDKYSAWIRADEHLRFLVQNSEDEELIIFASASHLFLHAVVVSEARLDPLDIDDLLGWNQSAFHARAGYVTGGGSSDVWISHEMGIWGSETLKEARPLGFVRSFEGLPGSDRNYFELLQEYAHVSGIHWRPELKAYCCFNENGDFDHIVSVTFKENENFLRLVSFKWDELEEYLAASKSVLVRMFDFTMFRPDQFEGWPEGPEVVHKDGHNIFYRQKVDEGKAAYTRGVQIISPMRSQEEIFGPMGMGWKAGEEKEYCDFIVQDWRNRQTVTISAHPSSTTNYFTAADNSLPFDMSPVFFRPEVLNKYKADREKYTVSEEHRYIHCRGGWQLRNFDVNEAGQVYTYICRLRDLPYSEQQYWRSFNEAPKAVISRRSYENHFLGVPTEQIDPLARLLFFLRQWKDAKVGFWQIHDESLFEAVNTPHTNGRDEWAQAFSDLSKLVTEGFQVKEIRLRLDSLSVEYSNEHRNRSITLLEKLLGGTGIMPEHGRLSALRTIQEIRSKVASHVSGGDARELANNALAQYESYTNHFFSVCNDLVTELELIEQAFAKES